MKKNTGRLTYLLVLIWSGFSQLYWQLNPQIAANHGRNLQISIFLILKGLTMIGPDILLLLMGAYLARQVRDAKSLLVKIWLSTLIVGSLLWLISSFFSTGALTTEFYNAALPVLRNSYPLISGALLGIILGRVVDQLNRYWQAIVYGLIISLITIATIFTPNLFGWSGQTVSLFYALVFILGWLDNRQRFLNWRKRWWGLIGSGALAFNLGLQLIMLWFSINGNTMDRYSTVTNILTVLVAISLVKLIPARTVIKMPVWLTWTFLAIVEASVTTTMLNNTVANPLNHSSGVLALITLAVLVTALLVTVLWQFWQQASPVIKFNHQLNQLSKATPQEQLMVIKGWGQRVLPNLILMIISYLIALGSMLLMSDGIRSQVDGKNVIAYTLGQRELLLLFTALIIFADIKFCQAIIKRYWVSLAIVVIFNLIFMVGNHVKIRTRFEPVLPADLSALNNELLKMVSTKVLIIAVVLILLIIIAVIWLERRFPLDVHLTWRCRLPWLLILPVLLVTSFFWNQS